MGKQIAVLSSFVWKIKEPIRHLTGYEPVRWMSPFRRPQFNSVVGWGFKATSDRARRLAKSTNKNYIAMEDGFVRSIVPGSQEIPVSFVVDYSGIYYDATNSSDLEKQIVERANSLDDLIEHRARAGMRLLRENRISKYNHAPFMSPEELGLDSSPRGGRVLVVDQTYGDSSIEYGMADTTSFERMFEAALKENPHAEIIVKTHPDVVSGRKKGYLTNLNDRRVKIITKDVNPWSLIEVVDKVYVVTSQLGFEALLAGRETICFGAPFYAGWGLTDDRLKTIRRSKYNVSPSREQLFAAIYFDYAHYVNPDSKAVITFEEAILWLIEKREHFLSSP